MSEPSLAVQFAALVAQSEATGDDTAASAFLERSTIAPVDDESDMTAEFVFEDGSVWTWDACFETLADYRAARS